MGNVSYGNEYLTFPGAVAPGDLAFGHWAVGHLGQPRTHDERLGHRRLALQGGR